jgi:thiamine biosynthesis lipoprotein
MTSFSAEVKRARPALGTLVTLQFHSVTESEVEACVQGAFQLIEQLEGQLSKFRETSDVARINAAALLEEIPVGQAFCATLSLAEDLWRESQGAFNPFAGMDFSGGFPIECQAGLAKKLNSCELDLSGIAKGYVVDRVVDWISGCAPQLSGVLNAGGDLRFFNCTDRQAQIRISGRELLREIQLSCSALATSSFSEMLGDTKSSTRYHQAPRKGLKQTFTLAALHDCCALADGLTKVGWFASPEITQQVVQHFSGAILILDEQGDMHEKFVVS